MLTLKNIFWLSIGFLLIGALTAIAATATIISIKLLFIIFLATFGAFALYLSGNIRLFIFYSMIFLSPWIIKKDFFYFSHMAGATSFDLHISDPFLLAMLAFQIQDRILRLTPSFRFPKPMYLWVSLMLLGLWSVVFNDISLPPAHEVYRMFRLLLWVLVLVNEVRRRKQFLHAAYALLIIATVQTAFAYLQVLGIDFGLEHYGQFSKLGMSNLGASTIAGEIGVLRISGIMTHPNILGAYLAISCGVSISLMFSTVNSLIKIIAAAVSASFAVIIILTLSRAAWIDFAIVITGVTLLTATNPFARARYLTHRTAIFAALLIIGIAFSGQIIKRLTHSVSQGISSRWDFIETSRKMIVEKPLFGYGLNTITFYQPPFNKYGSVDKMLKAYGDPGNWPVVHNSYLLVWVEQGTVGFFIWMWLHFSIIKTGIRNLRMRDPTLHALNIAFLMGYIAIMFDGLVSFFDRLQEGILIWIFTALIFALSYWRQENELTSNSSNNMAQKLRLSQRDPNSNWLHSNPLSNDKHEPELFMGFKNTKNSGWLKPNIKPTPDNLNHNSWLKK